MLSKTDNQLLTRTGPGTPTGELFRRYWIPALCSDELDQDGKPKRVKLLGEDLIAFRDSHGEVGLMDEACPHRGTSLYYGINNGCGLTCMYHGWKFDVDGHCVDIPSEPTDKLKKSIKLKSYPIHEQNGIIWTYMGPKEKMPPVPNFYWMKLPEENLMAERVWQDCNYLQVIENDLDFVHAAFLHKALINQDIKENVLCTDLGINPDHPLVKNPPVKQAVQDTNYGKRCVAVGIGDEINNAYMEIHYIFPFYSYPPRFAGEDGMFHAFIPRDDESTWSWDIQFAHHNPIDVETQHIRRGLLVDENHRKLRNVENDYEQDQTLMKTLNFSGIRGIATQDHAATESMGTIVDRSTEHLGTSDLPIIHMRKMLLDAVNDLQEGKDPLTLENHSLQTLLSEGLYASKEKSWQDAFPLKERFDKGSNVMK